MGHSCFNGEFCDTLFQGPGKVGIGLGKTPTKGKDAVPFATKENGITLASDPVR